MATAAGVIKQGSSGPNPGRAIWNASVCRPGRFDCVYTDSLGFFLIPSYFIPGETLVADAGTSYDSQNFVPQWNSEVGAYYAIIELVYNPPPPSSCFIGETLVLMANGDTKRIDTISEGDVVLGEKGTVNTVVDIEVPILGNRQLYAINDGPHFITSEHPVMTVDGWKSINPKATAEENANLSVGALRQGDRLVKLERVSARNLVGPDSFEDVTVEPILTLESINRIDAIQLDWNLPLYNLILDGSHTYFANNLLAHNKGGH